MDFIGYVERFETDFNFVCKTLKLDDVELTSINVRTNPKPECDPHNMKRSDYKYLDKYNQRSIEIVNEVYAKDFEYFGYQMLDPKDFPEHVEEEILKPEDLIPRTIEPEKPEGTTIQPPTPDHTTIQPSPSQPPAPNQGTDS